MALEQGRGLGGAVLGLAVPAGREHVDVLGPGPLHPGLEPRHGLGRILAQVHPGRIHPAGAARRQEGHQHGDEEEGDRLPHCRTPAHAQAGCSWDSASQAAASSMEVKVWTASGSTRPEA